MATTYAASMSSIRKPGAMITKSQLAKRPGWPQSAYSVSPMWLIRAEWLRELVE